MQKSMEHRPSVNFVFDFIFVFVNDLVFSLSSIYRFRKYFRVRFRSVFVLSFFQYRFRLTLYRKVFSIENSEISRNLEK